MHPTPLLPGLSPVGPSHSQPRSTGRLSSDGGLIGLREIASRLELAQVIAGRLRDDRDPHVSCTATPRWRWRACS
jgi:hypothetical protein